MTLRTHHNIATSLVEDWVTGRERFIVLAIDDLLTRETPNGRWLRKNSPAIHRAYLEMEAERKDAGDGTE